MDCCRGLWFFQQNQQYCIFLLIRGRPALRLGRKVQHLTREVTLKDEEAQEHADKMDAIRQQALGWMEKSDGLVANHPDHPAAGKASPVAANVARSKQHASETSAGAAARDGAAAPRQPAVKSAARISAANEAAAALLATAERHSAVPESSSRSSRVPVTAANPPAASAPLPVASAPANLPAAELRAAGAAVKGLATTEAAAAASSGQQALVPAASPAAAAVAATSRGNTAKQPAASPAVASMPGFSKQVTSAAQPAGTVNVHPPGEEAQRETCPFCNLSFPSIGEYALHEVLPCHLEAIEQARLATVGLDLLEQPLPLGAQRPCVPFMDKSVKNAAYSCTICNVKVGRFAQTELHIHDINLYVCFA